MLANLKTAWQLATGARALRKGDGATALAKLNAVIRQDPQHHIAHINRGVAFQLLGQHTDAIDDFSLALQLVPGLVLAHHNRGTAWKALGHFDRAIDDHKRAIALSPYYAPAHGELAINYVSKAEVGLAIDSANTSLRLAPNVRTPHLARGLAHYCRGDFKAAAADFRAGFVVERLPVDLLMLYLSQARVDDSALAELGARSQIIRTRAWPTPLIGLYLGQASVSDVQAAATTPEAIAETHFFVGHYHRLRSERAEAIAAFEAAIDTCPPFFIEHIAATADLKRMASER
jgi:lipoprotein NlpI